MDETRANDEINLEDEQEMGVDENDGWIDQSENEGWVDQSEVGVGDSGGGKSTMGMNAMLLMDGLARLSKSEKEERRKARVSRR